MIEMPHPRLVWAVLALVIALTLGSMVRLVSLRKAEMEARQKRTASLLTWWVLAGMLAAATLTGVVGISLLLGLASGIAVWEFGRLVVERDRRWAVWLVILVSVAHYLAIVCDVGVDRLARWQWGVVWVLAMTYLLLGWTPGYIREVAGLSWSSWVLVFGLSHAVLLARLPDTTNPVAGPVGWFFYLVLLTESNDIAQALIGRRWGRDKRHRIAPTVSPNKTWEGFLGGALVTVVLAAALAPWLTPLLGCSLRWSDGWSISVPGLPAILAGVIVVIAGFFGDINMSAVKRDAGAKDSSQLLPGMGGMIDRVDSLTFAAPAFYWFVVLALE